MRLNQLESKEMPTYEYQCESCDLQFEKIVKFEDRKRSEAELCPGCQSKGTVKFKISCPAISYSHPGNMKTSDSFNDRLKEIRKGIPKDSRGNLDNVIK